MTKYNKLLLSNLLIGIGGYFLYKQKPNLYNNKFTYDDVKLHNKESDVWVTYKNNVYDITKFIDNHPGGKSKIMLAAGTAIDPYWNIYKQHTNNPSIIKDILDPLKIGVLKDYDEQKYNDFKDVYVNDPIRDSELKFHSLKPCNAETPIKHIMNNWITPTDYWYIRNHNPVPDVDINKYELNLSYDSCNLDKKYTLKQLQNMPTTKVISTIQCGGNRRHGYNRIEKTSGTKWGIGAISTAEWEGISLKKFLLENDIDSTVIAKNNIKHIHFESIDGVKASIPISKVFDTEYGGDVLLAFKMNGEELPRDHGYPLRMIIPGYVGIRNIKWVNKITLSDTEIDSVWQTGLSYKGLPHYIKDVKDISLDKIAPIYEMPVQSCIADISCTNSKLKVKGFAWAGGGRNIIRVDVSANNGKKWKIAKLKEGSDQKLNCAWAWTFWEAEFEAFPDEYFEIVCKATDQSYNIQPETPKYIWNLRGLNNNSWQHMFFWNRL